MESSRPGASAFANGLKSIAGANSHPQPPCRKGASPAVSILFAGCATVGNGSRIRKLVSSSRRRIYLLVFREGVAGKIVPALVGIWLEKSASGQMSIAPWHEPPTAIPGPSETLIEEVCGGIAIAGIDRERRSVGGCFFALWEAAPRRTHKAGLSLELGESRVGSRGHESSGLSAY